MIVGITRVRNEELILEDTLRNVLARVDRVILYDDVSTDKTAEIAASFDRVEVIKGDEWRLDRAAEETRHRSLLLESARESGAEWCWCFDADERIVGDFPDMTADGYRFRLFDGYMAKGFEQPYRSGNLASLPRLWGPECRKILMLFRVSAASFSGRDKREPEVRGRIDLAEARVKHFGKCLSVEHWESTCDYYARFWDEPYRSKWNARRGKALHAQSDFGRPLHAWEDAARHAVSI